MAWEWVTKSARKAAELGAEYLQHSGLIDRLIKLPPDTAGAEIERTWSSLDDRARAGFKMTLGALILKQQAISTPDGNAKLQRLLDLRTRVDPTAGGATSPAKSWNETIARARDRVTTLVDKAGSIPRAEMFAALRRELDAHRPQIEAKGAATWNALSTRLNALAARAEAMGKDPEARAALAAFRDAMIAALAAHVAADHTPQTSPDQTNSVTSAHTARPPAPPAPAPQPVTPPKPPAPAPPPAQTIGGLWSGVLRNGDETMEMTIRISPAGRTMYCYRDTQGYREVELTSEGQQIQYVPSGGGVVTVRVLDLSKSARVCGHLIAWSFERAAYGYMDQQYLRIAMQCELRGDKLAVAYAESGETYMSDLSMMIGGGTNTRQFQGTLERQKE